MTLEERNELKRADKFEDVITNISNELDNEKIEKLRSREYHSSREGVMDYQMGLGLWLRNTILKRETIADCIPFYDAIYTDCYSTAIIYLLYRKLNGYTLYTQWILSNCNWMVFQSIPVMILEYMSIRRRIHYGIRCLEILLEASEIDRSEYSHLLEYLIEHVNEEQIGEWHYPYIEMHPRSILESDYDETTFKYLRRSQYDKFRTLYCIMDDKVVELILNLFEISTKDLHAGVENQSQSTLEKLINIAVIVKENGLELPVFQIKVEAATTIDDNNGWGHYIRYEDSVK